MCNDKKDKIIWGPGNIYEVEEDLNDPHLAPDRRLNLEKRLRKKRRAYLRRQQRNERRMRRKLKRKR